MDFFYKGTNYDGAWDKWLGPDGRNYTYDFSRIYYNSLAGIELQKLSNTTVADENKMYKLREEAKVKCGPRPTNTNYNCKITEKFCLFNIIDDPCEFINLAPKYVTKIFSKISDTPSIFNSRYPTVVKMLFERIKYWNSTAVPPANLPQHPNANPENWDFIWTNFGDFENKTRSKRRKMNKK